MPVWLPVFIPLNIYFLMLAVCYFYLSLCKNVDSIKKVLICLSWRTLMNIIWGRQNKFLLLWVASPCLLSWKNVYLIEKIFVRNQKIRFIKSRCCLMLSCLIQALRTIQTMTNIRRCCSRRTPSSWSSCRRSKKWCEDLRRVPKKWAGMKWRQVFNSNKIKIITKQIKQ